MRLLITRLIIGSAAGIMLVFPAPTQADHIPSDSDLWDVSQGTVVTAHSPVMFSFQGFNSDIRDMFGGTFGAQPEPGNTLFQDGQPTGTLHWVEWQTADAITLRSFSLFAHHDGPPRDANFRGFSEFRLFAFNQVTGEFDNMLFQLFTGNPYGDTIAPPSSEIDTSFANHLLLLHGNVIPTTTDRFRAEFVQFGFGASNASGPRIIELDGWDTFHEQISSPEPVVIPEPSSLVLLGIGMLALAVVRQRRRRSA